MPISTKARNDIARVFHPHKSTAKEICDALDAASAGVATEAQDNAAAVAVADGNLTITKAQGQVRKVPPATLTANRTLTLDPTGYAAGEKVKITRLGTEAFTLAVVNGGPGAGTLVTLPVSKVAFAQFGFDGTNFALEEVGTL